MVYEIIAPISHFTGREVKVTVVDHGSEDETIGIARFFARYGMKVDIKSGAPLASTLGGAEGSSKEVHERNKYSKRQIGSSLAISIRV